ncbi:MAG: S8 family serine peptidase [Candidatus Micrarchaeota archaeon]
MVVFWKDATKTASLKAIASSAGVLGVELKSVLAFSVRVPKDRLISVASNLKREGALVKVDSKLRAMLNDSAPIVLGVTRQEWYSTPGLGLNGSGVIIAILDTGIRSSHPDLDDLDDDPITSDPKIVGAIDFSGSPSGSDDMFGHGTHVASIAAGTGIASDYKFVGVAPQAWLLNVKVLGDDGSGSESSVAQGIEWAADQGANVISLSLGQPGWSPVIDEVVHQATLAGAVVVAAAGNSGPGELTVMSPASAPYSIAVGATDKSGGLAWFSSRGPGLGAEIFRAKPDVLAPGVLICAARAPGSYIDQELPSENRICGNDNYFALSGTSMATPHVSGLAALLFQAKAGNSTSSEIRSMILQGSRDLGLEAFEQGAGLVNATASLVQSLEIVSDGFSMDPIVLTQGSRSWKQFSARNFGSQPMGVSFRFVKPFDFFRKTASPISGGFSEPNRWCLAPEDTALVNFSVSANGSSTTTGMGFLEAEEFPGCDFLAPPSTHYFPASFGVWKEIAMDFVAAPPVFSIDEYASTWDLSYFSTAPFLMIPDRDNNITHISGLIAYDSNMEVTDTSYHFTPSPARIKVFHLLGSMDFGTSLSQSYVFDENLARDADLDSITKFNSEEGLRTFRVVYSFLKSNATEHDREGYDGLIFGDVSPSSRIEDYRFGVHAASDTLLDGYYAEVWPLSENDCFDGACGRKISTIKAVFRYPFTQLDPGFDIDNVSEKDITFSATIPHIDTSFMPGWGTKSYLFTGPFERHNIYSVPSSAHAYFYGYDAFFTGIYFNLPYAMVTESLHPARSARPSWTFAKGPFSMDISNSDPMDGLFKPQRLYARIIDADGFNYFEMSNGNSSLAYTAPNGTVFEFGSTGEYEYANPSYSGLSWLSFYLGIPVKGAMFGVFCDGSDLTQLSFMYPVSCAPGVHRFVWKEQGTLGGNNICLDARVRSDGSNLAVESKIQGVWVNGQCKRTSVPGGSPLLVATVKPIVAMDREVSGGSLKVEAAGFSAFANMAVEQSAAFMVSAVVIVTVWFFYDRNRNMKKVRKIAGRRRH